MDDVLTLEADRDRFLEAGRLVRERGIRDPQREHPPLPRGRERRSASLRSPASVSRTPTSVCEYPCMYSYLCLSWYLYLYVYLRAQRSAAEANLLRDHVPVSAL
jgi:hypothetical protein